MNWLSQEEALAFVKLWFMKNRPEVDVDGLNPSSSFFHNAVAMWEIDLGSRGKFGVYPTGMVVEITDDPSQII